MIEFAIGFSAAVAIYAYLRWKNLDPWAWRNSSEETTSPVLKMLADLEIADDEAAVQRLKRYASAARRARGLEEELKALQRNFENERMNAQQAQMDLSELRARQRELEDQVPEHADRSDARSFIEIAIEHLSDDDDFRALDAILKLQAILDDEAQEDTGELTESVARRIINDAWIHRLFRAEALVSQFYDTREEAWRLLQSGLEMLSAIWRAALMPHAVHIFRPRLLIPGEDGGEADDSRLQELRTLAPVRAKLERLAQNMLDSSDPGMIVDCWHIAYLTADEELRAAKVTRFLPADWYGTRL